MDDLQPALQEALNFTERELALNRKGRLSHRQAVRLGHGRPRVRQSVLAVALLCAAAGLVLFLTGSEQPAFIALALAGTFWFLRTKVDRRRGPVRPVTGRVDGYAIPASDGTAPHTHICIGALDVPVAPDVFRALTDAPLCRAHVAPDRTGRLRIVSAEPVDAPAEAPD